MNTRELALAAAAALTLNFGSVMAHAEEGVGEKMSDKSSEIVDTTKSGLKKTGRAMKDAVCMKGDVACAAQKGKHKMQNGMDSVGDKANELGHDVKEKTK